MHNKPLLTGQDIHAAFVHATDEPDKPPLVEILAEWDKISGLSRERYRRMAVYLNSLMETKESHERKVR